MKRSAKFLISWVVTGVTAMIPAVGYGLGEHRLRVSANVRKVCEDKTCELEPRAVPFYVAASVVLGPISIVVLVLARARYYEAVEQVAIVQSDRRAYGAA